DEIIEKLASGNDIDIKDIIKLTFTPVMGGKMDKSEKILKAIKLSKDITSPYKRDMESILYAFANKFLSGKDLEKVKEELRVTEIGKSLIEEGKEEGKNEGKKEKAIEIAKKAILKGMDNDTIKDLTDLSIDEIEAIRHVI
ncbi:MAG: hypothetical protein ACRC3Y_06610, partial [Romboutsia sp.]|uniref:hypothetical protein n=1 Tax=Romboutsia sp. TaxID=1965302 RepID=UPI003F2C3086